MEFLYYIYPKGIQLSKANEDLIMKVIVTFVMMIALRYHLRDSVLLPKYGKYINKVWIFGLILLVLARIFEWSVVNVVYYVVLVSGTLFVAYQSEISKPPRKVIVPAVVFIVASVISISLYYIPPAYYNNNPVYKEVAISLNDFYNTYLKNIIK